MKQFLTFTLLAIAGITFWCAGVEARATPGATPVATAVANYAADLHMSYNNGVWQCDVSTCPENTFGCTIQRRNDVTNASKLVRTNICYDKNNLTTMSTVQIITMPVAVNVSISINSFIGAESMYGSGYGGGVQYAWGLVAAADWQMFQNDYAGNIKNV